MHDRIFIALVIFSVFFLLFRLSRMRQQRAAKHAAAMIATTHHYQILYFSSVVCRQCSAQERILNEIFEDPEFHDVTLKKYSIEDNSAFAQQWGVKTLPTTILLSKLGEVKQINNGLVSASSILSQLRKLRTNSTA